jgi:hypothetical protein
MMGPESVTTIASLADGMMKQPAMRLRKEWIGMVQKFLNNPLIS